MLKTLFLKVKDEAEEDDFVAIVNNELEEYEVVKVLTELVVVEIEVEDK